MAQDKGRGSPGRDRGTRAASEGLLRKHRKQLEGAGYAIYALFDAIEQAELSDEDVAALREPAARLVEAAIHGRARVDGTIAETAKAIVALGMPEARAVMSAWQGACEAAAGTSRRGLELVLRDFGPWIGQLDSAARASFCEALPRLAPCADYLGQKGMAGVVRTVRAAKSREAADVVLQSMAEYGRTDPRAVAAVSRIAERAIRLQGLDALKRLVEVLPAAKVLNHRDAERLFPAMADLSDACAKAGKGVWGRAFDLIRALASRNCSGAYIAARDLPKCIGQIQAEAAERYLQDVTRLVEAMGVGAAWFGLEKLPGLYQKHGPERAHAFVQTAASAAAAYGPTAAWQFLEAKTPVAREFLEG